MAGQSASNTDLFEAYFKRADLDGDGQISGAEAVAFFQGSNLPKQVLAQVWSNADQRKAGFLNRSEFFNALKLVTVAQSKRELTPDIVKAALYGPASAKIPAPQINLAATPSAHSKVGVAAPQLSGTPLPQNMGVRGPPGPGNVSTNQQFSPSQPNQFIRPSQAMPSGTAPHPRQVLSGQNMQSGGTMGAPRPPTSNMSAAWLGGSTGSPLAGASSPVTSRGIIPPSPQDGFGLPASSLSPSVQPRPAETSWQTPTTSPKPKDSDSKALSVSGNGFSSDSLFGDVFSATPVQPKQDGVTSSAGSVTSLVPASLKPEPSTKPIVAEPLQGTSSQQPVGGQYHQGQSAGRQNQQFVAKSTPASTSTGPVGAVSSSSTQSHAPWPKMTQSEVQKYTKVFVQVDTDRDGKITGEQARNLFLSWRLPREVLKQVWDLSDQDNDSVLSLKEFCIALYLMERYREGRPLPTMLPSTIMPDEALFSSRGHPTAPHGSATWAAAAGLQQSHGTRPPTGKPPRPVPTVLPDRTVQPTSQKPKVPELEKQLVDQLSKEEQDSLNAKLKEATEADKKVEELENEILTSREKIQFYHAKMQELILYKSRCDNRLNEITERVAGDKREVELLAKKYEQKYKQSGDVASKLTLEEATFRDIQEKKMELYQAIVKMEGDSGDGALQQRTDRIQKELEDMVKNLNDRCKQYGLRAKPTSLVELPFGWQPGIQGGAADWDEVWDKLEDEGFTYVKEFTLDVQNVVAPPKQNSLLANNETISSNDGENTSSSDNDAKSEKDASSSNTYTKAENVASSSNTDAKSEKDPSKGEEISENELAHEQNDDGLTKGLPHSPAGSGAANNQSQEVLDSQNIKDVVSDGLPHGKETWSDRVGPESDFSGDKGFDEPRWGRFDSHYDTESVWGFDTDNAKDIDRDRHVENSMYGLEDFGLKPIRTESSTHNNKLFQGKTSSIFADSVPSTPAYSITNSPRRFSGGLDDYSFDKGKSPFVFADSVPSTPAYNFGNSPRRFSGALEDHSFDSFSRYDYMHDGGLFQSPRHSLARFDSVVSTQDSDQRHGLSSRFDSFNARDGGYFQSQNSLARFDSMHSTKDFDHGHGFPTFDDTDPFGSSGLFKTSGDSITENKSSGVPAFDDTDPFGSAGPFKTSVESKTQSKSSDNWSAF